MTKVSVKETKVENKFDNWDVHPKYSMNSLRYSSFNIATISKWRLGFQNDSYSRVSC